MEDSNNNQNIYKLTPKTLFEISETIAPRCICVLPHETNKKMQRFVVGTHKRIEIWECKKGEMVNAFKSE